MVSCCVVLLSPITVEALEEHEEHREKKRAEGFTDPDFAFLDARGGLVRGPNFMKRDWKPIVQAIGTPPTRIYNARHALATLLVSSGAPIKAIQGMLRYASPEIT